MNTFLFKKKKDNRKKEAGLEILVQVMKHCILITPLVKMYTISETILRTIIFKNTFRLISH